MSSAMSAARMNVKGKLAERPLTDSHQSVPSDGSEHLQRDHHQRMVGHVRNNALDSLNNNPFHLPVPLLSAFPSQLPLGERTRLRAIDARDRSPYHHVSHRSDTDSTVTSASLPSPGSVFGTVDLGQVAFGPNSPLPRDSSTGEVNLGDQSVSTDKFGQPIGGSAPFVMGNKQDYSNLLDTSMFPNVILYNHSSHAAPLVFGEPAGKCTEVDIALGLGLNMPASGNSLQYSTFDAMTFTYGVPNTAAFGYSGMYAPTPFSGYSGLHNGGQCINTGCLHTPQPMTASSDHGSRAGLDEHECRERPVTWELPASPLHSVSPSPIEAVSRGGALRRSSDSPIAEGPNGRGRREHKRKLAWTHGMANEGPNVSKVQKEQELRELELLQQGGPATRRERRRLQNRLAQRAFRARSKLQNSAAATYLTNLEELADVQAEQLSHMQEATDKLQAENLQMRADRLNQVKGAGPDGRSGANARRYSTPGAHMSTETAR